MNCRNPLASTSPDMDMESYTAAMDPNLGPDACVTSTSTGPSPQPWNLASDTQLCPSSSSKPCCRQDEGPCLLCDLSVVSLARPGYGISIKWPEVGCPGPLGLIAMVLAILHSPCHPDCDGAVGYLMTFPLSGLICMGRDHSRQKPSGR